MNEDIEFDTVDNLPPWATLREVSSYLHINHDKVRSTARRAMQNEEPWVKKEEVGGQRLLIDTSHETFKAHVKRWLQNTGLGLEGGEPYPWSSSAHSGQSHDGYTSSYPTSIEDLYTLETTRLFFWPALRQWLHELGLQVFMNVLAEDYGEQQWHWQWGALHGKGYESVEKAIIAALQSQFDENRRELQEVRQQLSGVMYQEAASEEVPKRRGIFNLGGD